MLTSIIIPACNAQEYTESCLLSIIKHTAKYEVVLIDNGSRPPYTYEHQPVELNGRLVIYRSKNNMGFPAAINLGAELAKGENICILNNDLVVTPGWLDTMLECIDNDLLDVVGPITNSISGPQQVSIGYYSNEEELATKATENLLSQYGQFSRLHRLVGFCLVMRKKTWEDTGGFNEIFTPGNFEDDDFCLRAIEKGYRLGYVHNVYLHHFGSITHGLLGINYNSLLAKNAQIFRSMWSQERVDELVRKNGG